MSSKTIGVFFALALGACDAEIDSQVLPLSSVSASGERVLVGTAEIQADGSGTIYLNHTFLDAFGHDIDSSYGPLGKQAVRDGVGPAPVTIAPGEAFQVWDGLDKGADLTVEAVDWLGELSDVETRFTGCEGPNLCQGSC